MVRRSTEVLLILAISLFLNLFLIAENRKTKITIEGDEFRINGKPTYEGIYWQGHKIEGLLMNARLVQAIFDDLNPETRSRWNYPDDPWDPDRNTNEFIAAMKSWKDHGLLCAVINLQGGSPEGYSKQQPWHNSAITEDGSLRNDYMHRLEKIINHADEIGMIIMLGIFYFGQDHRIKDENAVKQAVINTVNWIAERKYTNILLEIANEYNIKYKHDIIRKRPIELINIAKEEAKLKNIHLPVSISMSGGQIPV